MPRPVKEIKEKKLKKKYTKLRGVKDVLFDEYKYWDLVQDKIINLAKIYGYQRIDTPILEKFDLFKITTGEDTNLFSKEMYSFIDKNGDKIALRPEATPGLVRSYIEHSMFALPQPVKMFWMGPLLRYEKPQSGKFRQHTQFNLDVIGEKNPFADIQLILIAYNFFKELQLKVQVQINSIGCEECQPNYIKELVEFYKERGKRSKLCNDCKKRFVKNPLRLLDCEEEDCVAVKEGVPQIVDFLCDGCRDHLIKILEYLDELEVPYNLDPSLVRGLDYYNRTVFEFISVEEDNENENRKKPLSLGGGGRYDNLIERTGGNPAPACGFGIGIERVIMKIKEMNIPLKEDKNNFIFLAQIGDSARREAFLLFEDLRRSGYNVRQALTKDSLKLQLEEAKEMDVRYTVILGQKEIIDGTIIIRDMESRNQEVVDYKKIKQELDKRLDSNEDKQ